jgi:hypothetical protein
MLDFSQEPARPMRKIIQRSRRGPQNHLQVMFFLHTLTENKIKIFLVYQEIQMGSVAKSYMTNGLIIYD